MIGWVLTEEKFKDKIQKMIDAAKLDDLHQLLLLNSSDISYSIETEMGVRLWHRGKPIDPPDFFVFYGIESEADAAYALARQLETLGSAGINDMNAKRVAKSKIATYQVLAKAGIPVPKTFVFKKDIDRQILLDELGLPMVIKPDDAFGGFGVELINTDEELDAALERVKNSEHMMLVQEYIESSRGRDLRILMIAHEPRFAICRKASDPGEFRSNIAVGGHAEAFELTDEIRAFARKISKVMGLNFAGLDLLFAKDGFIVAEVNSSPGHSSNKELFAQFFDIGQRELDRAPYPHWRFIRLMERAKGEQLAELLSEMDDLTFEKAVAALAEKCETVQRTVLQEILSSCADTEFGRRYGFVDIKNVEEYRARVPLSEWEDYKDYMRKIELGEADILFPGKADFFYRTSGTTENYKHVPDSERGKIGRRAITRARFAKSDQYVSRKQLEKILVLTNRPEMDRTEAGIDIGSASGHSARMVASKIVYPVSLGNHYSGSDLLYMILRCALTYEDVTAVLSNNALSFSTLAEFGADHADELISDICTGSSSRPIPDELADDMRKYLTPNPKRAAFLKSLHEEGRFLPLHYWPDIKIGFFWLGGSVGLQTDRVKNYLPSDACLMDVGYGASEVKINIPIKEGSPVGTLASFCGFFEFIPEEGGEPLLAHQLKDGERYELVVTTYAGLYRFKLKDIVAVDGFTGTTPNIYFVNRLSDMANLAMEKLSGSMLADAVGKAFAALGLKYRHVQIYPDPVMMCYHICVEPDGEVNDPAAAEAAVEQTLQEELARYSMYRRTVINESKLHLMKKGWGESLMQKYAKNSASSAQVKIPVVTNVMPEDI